MNFADKSRNRINTNRIENKLERLKGLKGREGVNLRSFCPRKEIGLEERIPSC